MYCKSPTFQNLSWKDAITLFYPFLHYIVKKKVGIFHLIYHILFKLKSFLVSFNSILLCWCCRLGGHAIFVNQNCTIWFTLICKAKINSYTYKWITHAIICLYLVGIYSLNAAVVIPRSIFGFLCPRVYGHYKHGIRKFGIHSRTGQISGTFS